MEIASIIQKLEAHQAVFQNMFANLSEDEIRWRPYPEHWCLLEIVCHLCDEEREDFRLRTRSILDNPDQQLPAIDPVGWVKERAYLDQDFTEKLALFLKERAASIAWLRQLEHPNWNNAYHHPSLGKITARQFLINWLAHDFLHIRQITRVKYLYLAHKSGEDITYAGQW